MNRWMPFPQFTPRGSRARRSAFPSPRSGPEGAGGGHWTLPGSSIRSTPGFVLWILVAAVFGCLDAGRAEPVPNRPNVIVLFVDQYRSDLCGAYGGGKNISTPNIDRLAREGITFDNALAICPLCTPARGMFMSGRYGTHTGAVLNFTQFNPNQPTIARAFRAAGYQTGFIGKWHLAAGYLRKAGKFQNDQAAVRAYRQENPAFDFVPPGPQRLGFEYWAAYNFHASFLAAPYYRDAPEALVMKGYETDAEFDLGMEFIRDQVKAGHPFFLMIAPHPPHPPFRPGMCPAGYLADIPETLVWPPNVPENHPRREKPLEMRCYLAMAKNFDDNVGRLLRFLDDSALAGSTLVLVTSDHGEMHGSHNRTDKMVPYAEAVRIPMVARWPGHIPAGIHSATLQTHLDHFPTLCALAGIPVPEHLDGVDLSRELLGQGKVEREAVLMMSYSSHWDFFQTGTSWPEWRAVKTPRYTYVKWLKGSEELYDDREDPYQMTNLAGEASQRGMVEKLGERLKELLRQADDEFLPGTAYADWFDDDRNVIRTALGPVTTD